MYSSFGLGQLGCFLWSVDGFPECGWPWLKQKAEKWLAKALHKLISGTCEYVILCGKRNFADVIKVIDFEIGDHTELSGWTFTSLIT